MNFSIKTRLTAMFSTAVLAAAGISSLPRISRYIGGPEQAAARENARRSLRDADIVARELNARADKNARLMQQTRFESQPREFDLVDFRRIRCDFVRADLMEDVEDITTTAILVDETQQVRDFCTLAELPPPL